MRSILVAGNWKMHGSKVMVKSLLEALLEAPPRDGVDLAVFPPFPYLSQTQNLLDGSSIGWGAQTLNPVGSGAHTGEVAASMLRDFGCRYVLVGHSERRTLYGEGDEDVADRFGAALDAGLEPVLCVGETLDEREQGQTEAVVQRQLEAVLGHSGIGGFRRATVAYEPVWAIGTGKTASDDQAQEAHAFIRALLTELYDEQTAGATRILYGGSVKPDNVDNLMSQPDVDGALVGGASLKAEDFARIVNFQTTT